MNRRIRELCHADIHLIVNYFLKANHAFLRGMGAEPSKLPDAETWHQILRQDLEQTICQRQFYYVIWELNDTPVGHSNLNKIVYGKAAFMHLHLWQPDQRQSGHGTYFLKASIARYFETFQLETLLCEPYALNPAPNKILPKVGFKKVKTYETTPGWINFHQLVNRWELTKDRWLNS